MLSKVLAYIDCVCIPIIFIFLLYILFILIEYNDLIGFFIFSLKVKYFFVSYLLFLCQLHC